MFIISCKPQVPSKYIQPDDMEDLIYDFHLAQGIAVQQEGNDEYNRRLALELVLKDHGYTQAEFDSSLVYYYTRADRFQEIYKNVQLRLDKESEKYGGAVSQFQNIASSSLSGDTADVWKGERMLMLFNDRPYHIYKFSFAADTTYHAGDSFLLTFNTTWLMQNGNRQAAAYMVVTYANDSTTKAFSTISTSGLSTLRIPYCKEPVKQVRGYIMCGMRPNTDGNNDLCVLYIDNIQLARFHNKLVDQPALQPLPQRDSLPALKPDSAQYDSLRRPAHLPGNRPMTMGDVMKMQKQNNKKNIIQ